MGYTLQTHKTTLRKPRRIFRTKHKLFKLFLNLFIVSSLLVSIPTHIKRAMAIETVKASALVPEEMRADTPLSFTQKSPPSALDSSNSDPCLSLLTLSKGSTSSHLNDAPGRLSGRPTRHTFNVERTAAPAALGFILGVRIALGPNDVVRKGERVQIASEIHASNAGTNHALAIAAYRGCKNDYALKQTR